MNYFSLATPEQLLCLTMGICGLGLFIWLKWQDDRQGGLEKSSNWMSFMVPCLMFLAVQLQLITHMVMNRMG
jgi:hypothetical protein